MFDLTGKIKDLSIDFKTGSALLTLSINEKQSAMNLFDKLNGEEKLSINIGKYREKRSLNANGYMWTLCGELAKKMSNAIDQGEFSLSETALRNSRTLFDRILSYV